MDQTLKWALQVAILAPALYLFLRFLRRTRGGGVLRGLVVALAFGVLGLWGLAKYFDLAELNYLIGSITPFLAVILTILFQPELRRAIARLGTQNRFARFFKVRRHETIHIVAEAAREMAGRRHGALIAFQRDESLDTYTQAAVRVDAEVRRLVLESIFHPGGALHDGAVVIEGDRIAAAACLFPLTENIEISKSTGTRHRAALGLTEESDAVTLVVSEETGSLAVCHRGQIERHVPPDRLEEVLLQKLEADAQGEKGARAGRTDEREQHSRLRMIARELFVHDLPRKAAALLLAAGMIWVAYQELVIEHDIVLTVVSTHPGETRGPAPGLLEIRMPGRDYHLVSPGVDVGVELVVSGTRGQLESIGFNVGGVLSVGSEVGEAAVELPLEDVVWNLGPGAERIGLAFRWKDGAAPLLKIERYDHLLVPLDPKHVPVDLQDLDPRFKALTGQIVFRDDQVEVEGPRAAVAALRQGEIPFQLEPIVVAATDRKERRKDLRLSQELRDRRLAISEGGRVGATLKIIPAERDLGTIEVEVRVAGLRPSEDVEPERWTIFQQHQKATFTIRTAGIIPVAAEPGSAVFVDFLRGVRGFVEKNLRAWVDVSYLDQSQGTTLPLEWKLRGDWRSELPKLIGEELDEQAELVLILETDPMIRLQKKDEDD